LSIPRDEHKLNIGFNFSRLKSVGRFLIERRSFVAAKKSYGKFSEFFEMHLTVSHRRFLIAPITNNDREKAKGF